MLNKTLKITTLVWLSWKHPLLQKNHWKWKTHAWQPVPNCLIPQKCYELISYFHQCRHVFLAVFLCKTMKSDSCFWATGSCLTIRSRSEEAETVQTVASFQEEKECWNCLHRDDLKVRVEAPAIQQLSNQHGLKIQECRLFDPLCTSSTASPYVIIKLADFSLIIRNLNENEQGANILFFLPF